MIEITKHKLYLYVANTGALNNVRIFGSLRYSDIILVTVTHNVDMLDPYIDFTMVDLRS
jgi:hypothetical protein